MQKNEAMKLLFLIWGTGILYIKFINTFIFMIAEPRLCRDVQHILVCIRKLPAQDFSAETVRNYGRLDEFLAQKFGTKVDEW
jgi:hypothetical protein